MAQLWSAIVSLGELVVKHTTSLSLLSTIGLGILIGGHYYYKNKYSYWERKSVPGPKPVPVFGNIIQFIWGPRMVLERKWLKQYGKMMGIYFGKQPILVVADPEVARQICIRDFDVFPNHQFSGFINEYQKVFLISLVDEHWKRVRSLMSPTFTSGKIKRMFKLLEVCADDLIECINEQVKIDSDGSASQGKVINVKECYNLYTMDAIASCCYGLKLDRFGASNVKAVSSRNDFVAVVMKLFEFSTIKMLLIFSLPKLILKMMRFEISSARKLKPLALRTQKIIEARRKQGTTKKFDDYLQILIDAELEDKLELNDMDLVENHHAGLTKDSLEADQERLAKEAMGEKAMNGTNDTNDINGLSKGPSQRPKVQLTDHELLSNAMFLLMVGVETTGSLLTSCTCLLAFKPDIQERLYEEIKSVAKFDPVKGKHFFEYESLTCCHYLDSVLSETLRIYPPATRTDRVAKQNYRIDKYNIELAAGDKLVLGLFEMMNDPDHWTDPETFNPDRFMPANRDQIVPGSYCPFGLGPRHCLGMRFSLTEAKVAMAKLLMSYRIEPSPDTQYPPEPKLSMSLNSPKKPLVKMVPRI